LEFPRDSFDESDQLGLYKYDDIERLNKLLGQSQFSGNLDSCVLPFLVKMEESGDERTVFFDKPNVSLPIQGIVE
jgi:hypothetical protein